MHDRMANCLKNNPAALLFVSGRVVLSVRPAGGVVHGTHTTKMATRTSRIASRIDMREQIVLIIFVALFFSLCTPSRSLESDEDRCIESVDCGNNLPSSCLQAQSFSNCCKFIVPLYSTPLL